MAPENVDREALQQYAIEAANFSTNYQMPDLEFAVNHYGKPDIALFDFTSMYAAENASKVLERNGYRLLMMLVGDSLLEVGYGRLIRLEHANISCSNSVACSPFGCCFFSL